MKSSVNAAPCKEDGHHRRIRVTIGLLLFVITATVYAPLYRADFVNYDDLDYVVENAHVTGGITGENLRWAFTRAHSCNWHPMTWISHMLDCEWWGLNAGAHHLTNVFLHCTNSVILFLVLHSMTGALWRSVFVAVLFAWHPLHVESVAWIAERKDVLSTFFGLLAIAAYVRHAKSVGLQGPRTRIFYGLTLLCFALALMSKPMLVTLPFVLLLLDYWPLRRVPDSGSRIRSCRPLIVEKIPFFALTAALCVATFIIQRESGAIKSIETFAPALRLANALSSYTIYTLKMLWPVKLAVFYPFPTFIPLWQCFAAGTFLIIASVLALRVRGRHPWLFVGWFWYLGTLVPVIGIVQVGAQALADRYTYIPLIGLFMAISWGSWCILENRRPARIGGSLAAVAISVALLACTGKQIGHWHNSIALFQHALAVGQGSAATHYGMGFALQKEGKNNEAIAGFTNALRYNPNFADAHYNLGNALRASGRISEAISQYEETIRLRPDYVQAHNNLAVSLAGQGHEEEAITHYQAALRVNPDYVDARYNLANLLYQRGKLDGAIEQYSELVRLKPGSAQVRNNLANILSEAGRTREAVVLFETALRIRPNFAEAHYNLANALCDLGQYDEAIAHYAEALELQPKLTLALIRLAMIRASHSDLRYRDGAQAVELARRAVEMTDSKEASTLDALAAALAETGQFDEAIRKATAARELAVAANQIPLVNQIDMRLKLYRAGLAFRLK